MRSPPTNETTASAQTRDVIEAVHAIYAATDADVAAAGPVCVASGRCCRFKAHGHALYLSNLEAEVLLADAPASPQRASAEGCPFQKDNLCTARHSRPLGCRIYFCDPNYQATAHAITEKALKRLKELADERQLPWRYAPLHVFLNERSTRQAGELGCHVDPV
jgi:hypothetical protein